MKAALYNEQKVLHFASRDEGLHVSITEPEDSDLTEIVEDLKERAMIQRVEHDDSGFYYHLTDKGLAQHYRNKIRWRQRNGRPCRKYRDKLAALEAK